MNRFTLGLMAVFALQSAHSQTPANPPAQADREIIATVIAGLLKPNQAACHSECQANAACTGYNFYVPGYTTRNQALNCSLLKDPVVREEAASGVVSCRMPCLAPLIASNGKALAAGSLGMTRPPTAKVPLLPTPGRPAPPPPPPPAQPAPPTVGPPATTTNASGTASVGIHGHEIVLGPYVSIPPLSIATPYAQCPAGKVALSVGYEFTGSGDTAFGLEVHGAFPEGDSARVTLRNANVAVTAQGRAIAVCTVPPANLRYVPIRNAIATQSPCADDERLIGGGTRDAGARSSADFWLAGNGPWQVAPDKVIWQGYLSLATPWGPLHEPRQNNYAIALCAKTASVPGWAYLATPQMSLGARAQTELTLSCPVGKVLLAAGHLQQARNDLDIVSNKLMLSRSGASARLMNRNILGAAPVVTSLSMLCADARP